jgi:glycosyltransferase 2 family protein
VSVRSLVGIALSLGLLAWFFYSQDLKGMGAAIRDANLAWIVPAVAVYFVGVWLRAMRWRILMAPFAPVPTARLFSVILIGFAVNNVLPLRLGELVRTFLLKRSHGVPIAASLATVLLERLLDVAALCAIMTLVLILVPLDGWVLALASFAALVAAGAVAGLLLLLVLPRALVHRLLDVGVLLAERLGPRVGALLRSFIDGVRALEDPRAVVSVGVLSVGCWVFELGLYSCMMVAFGFDSGVLSVAAGMVVANLATALPSSPGYVGTFDVPLQLLLTETFGVAEAVAGSYTLVTHAVLLVPVVVVGLALLGREDLSFRSLARGRVEARSAAGARP